MKIVGMGNDTYLYLNGIGINRPIKLRDNIELLPANCSVDTPTVLGLSQDQGEFGIALIFLWLVKSQFHITSQNAKKLATESWNAFWDAILLSAIYDCPAMCNFQSNVPIEEISSESIFMVTNHHLRGLSKYPYMLNDDDIIWLEKNYQIAYSLLTNPKFSNAVHCLATYHWHSLANAQLALIWSGIEGLFDINSELVFRLSLYIATFLEGANKEKMRILFNDVKQLYNSRSKAVHGSNINNDKKNSAVEESAKLLKMVLIKCITDNKLPNVDDLVP